MKLEIRKKLARTIAVAAAAMVLICVGFLIFDYLAMRYRTPLDKATVESMEEAVKTDANVAVELTAERDRQTDLSLRRRSRNLTFSYLLLAGISVFLVSINWLNGFEKDPALSLETLVTLRDQDSALSVVPAPLGLERESDATSGLDLSFVDEIVSQEGREKDAAVPILRAIQVHYGYLPDEVLQRVCEQTEITPAQIAGTSTFYSQFRFSPVGKHLVKLCHGTACHVSGIGQITDELKRQLSIGPDEDTDPSQTFTLEKVACLGCCSLAPVMMIDEETAGRLTPASACKALYEFESKEST